MASYRKRENGLWEYRISYKTADGKYKRKEKGGFKTKKEAQLAANDAETQLANGVVEDKNITLTDYFRTWMTIYKKDKITNTTYEKYEFSANVIEEYYRNTKLASITVSMHQDFLNQLSSRYVYETIKAINRHIRQSIKVALHEGTLKKDFTAFSEIQSKVDSKHETDKFLEHDVYFDLLRETRKRIKYQSNFFIYLVGKTGLKFSEAQAITLERINLEQMYLQVENTYKIYGKDRGWQPTKNPQSKRKVPLDHETVEVIKEYLEFGFKPNPDNRLFINVSNNSANKGIKRKTKTDATAHSLRHTYASYLIANDVNVVTIAKLLGHKDATETLKTYSHLFAKKQEEDFSKIRNLIEFFGADLGREI